MTTNRATPRVLAVGPLPPPPDGTSVSFELFCRTLGEMPQAVTLKIVDSSPKRLKDERTRKISWSNLRQALRVIVPFCRGLTAADRVLIFGSNRFLLSMGSLLLLIARLARRPCHLRVFGGSLDRFYLDSGRCSRWLFRRTLAGASGLIVQTRQLYDFFTELGGVEVYLVPGYRVLPAAPERPAEDALPGAGLKLVFVGHVREEKGVFVLLESLRRLPGVYRHELCCDIYGPVYDAAETRLRRELDRTATARYRGVLAPGEVVDTLRRYDALVFPTFYQGEGHPGVLIEAMMAGLPVISTEFRAIPELIDDRVNGLLVPPQDAEALAAAIAALADDPALRARLAAGNRQRRERYDASLQVPRMARLLGVRVGAAS